MRTIVSGPEGDGFMTLSLEVTTTVESSGFGGCPSGTSTALFSRVTPHSNTQFERPRRQRHDDGDFAGPRSNERENTDDARQQRINPKRWGHARTRARLERRRRRQRIAQEEF